MEQKIFSTRRVGDVIEGGGGKAGNRNDSESERMPEDFWKLLGTHLLSKCRDAFVVSSIT